MTKLEPRFVSKVIDTVTGYCLFTYFVKKCFLFSNKVIFDLNALFNF